MKCLGNFYIHLYMQKIELKVMNKLKPSLHISAIIRHSLGNVNTN